MAKEDEREYTSDIVADEGMMSKLVKAGLIAISASTIAAKSKGTRFEKIFNNEIIKNTAIVGTTLGLSEDNDYASDVTALATIAAIGHGNKFLKYSIQSGNTELYKTVFKATSKLDDIYKGVSLFSVNATDKLLETALESFDNNINAVKNSYDGSVFSLLASMGKAIGKTAIDVITSPIENIQKYGFKDGIKENLRNSYKTRAYNIFQDFFSDIDFASIENVSKRITPLDYIDTAKSASFGTSVQSMMQEALQNKGVKDFTVNDVTPDMLKKFKKYYNIKKDTTFTDSLGRFTNFNPDTNSTMIRLDRIIDEEANFAKGLNKLASNFLDSKKTDKSFIKLNAEQKEQKFVEYLKDNGFQELLDKTYKKNDLYSYGEINNLVGEQYFDELSSSLQNLFFNRKGTDYIKTSKDNDYIFGLTNNDILQNFAFTNVVKKTKNGPVDLTAFDGNIMSLQLLGSIEKNIVGHYKNPLAKYTNVWNPFKLIESKNRINNKIHNDYLQFAVADNGFLLNGRNIIENVFSEKLGDKIYANHTFYSFSKSRDFKYDSKKATIDILNESYSTAKDVQKEHRTYSDIYKTYKKYGFKKALEEYTSSFANPLGVRYNQDGFRMVGNDEGYYKEGSIINDIKEHFQKKGSIFGFRRREPSVINIDHLRKDNRKVEHVIQNLTTDIFYNTALRGEETFKEVKQYSIDEFTKLLEEALSFSESENEQLIIRNFLKAGKKAIEANQDLNVSLSDLPNITDKSTRTFLKSFAMLQNSKNSQIIEKTIAARNKAIIAANPLELAKNFVMDVYNEKQDFNVFRDLVLRNFKDNDEVMKGLYEYIDNFGEVIRIRSKAKTQIYSLANDKAKISYTNVRKYSSDIIVEDPKNFFNEAFEQIIGYEYNKTINKKKDFYNDAVEMLQNHNFTNDAFEYKGDIFTNKNIPLNFNLNSYSHFEKINQELISLSPDIDLNNLNLITAKNKLDSLKYTNREARYASNIIIKDTIRRHLESKSILESTAKTISKETYQLANAKGISKVVGDAMSNNHYMSKIGGTKIYGQNTDETTFNVFMKSIISGFQNAGEVIGLERIPNNILGNSWVEEYKNFFKYKYLPIAGLVLGGIAVNSLTDMMIPDSVPIIGNGAFGVATRAYGAARVGLQYAMKYTGALSILRGIENSVPGLIENGLTHFFDPLMDPSEMIDVYFKGKPIEVKKNRNWFTAGRQSGEGEEFGQYRPHLLYTLGNPSAGIYSNKITKFFRKDFLPTKYPWYILDPYKEERDAYNKFGAIYPKTEQLFKDIPVIGHFLSATVGEVIKPTQLIAEEQWKVGDNMMVNPHYDERNPYSPKYIEYTDPNRMAESVFEAIEDLKTLSGLPGYTLDKITQLMFGKSNPFENKVTLSSLDDATSYYRSYEKLQLGGMFGTTEAIRRLLDKGDSLGTIHMNPITQKIPEWLPPYFANGNNPYMSLDFGEYMLPGADFDKAAINDVADELKQLRMLSMTAPKSSNFEKLKTNIGNNIDKLKKNEMAYFYESLSYASKYGKRDYNDNFDSNNESESILLKIDKKISPYEFESDGKRYKLSAVEDDFNKLSKRYGRKRATDLMKELNSTFEEGDQYQFEINKKASASVGIDEDGDFLKVNSPLISKQLMIEDSDYNINRSNPITNILGLIGRAKVGLLSAFSPSSLDKEKIFGKRSVYNEWSTETVQTPFFRDWDSPISSFVEPYYNLSANNFFTFLNLNSSINESFNSSNADMTVLGLAALAGAATRPFNGILSRTTTSAQYKDDTLIQDELEKIKFISGDKSYYNMTGNENIHQLENMMNEQDAKFLEDILNVSKESERNKILQSANPRMKNVLKEVWNRHARLRNEKESNLYTVESEVSPQMQVVNVGPYLGNVDQTRNLLKASFGIGFSKLDDKRQGIIKSYRGTISEAEARYISNKIYEQYNSKPNISSTIYPKGNINIVRR